MSSSPAFTRPHNAPGNIMYQPYITHPLSPEFAQHIPGLQHPAFAYPFGVASTASYMQTPPMTPVARGNFVMAGRLVHARHFPSASSTSSIPDLEVLPSPALNATSPTLLATASPALLATLPPHLRAQYAQLAQGMPHVQQLPGPIEQCESPAVPQTIGARPLEEICLTDPVDVNWNENELLDEDS
ncbi:hypothetical protein M427DRAFT_162739 [Gonapodya prolifera JEL478]|uniref:Uncharacterized protein n=1 Tax=Gonapodya prolifera (strain JEL478) TaxID=1344416 RepID=A0A139AZB2_GONPJ|nr:hypothetical protein M427DRAFT_162739 [Gonapodya prolifera JEL478]|eukprot:KXS22040.1 hypothetical protein M427DRAFT_162739 [Gonapodya prolifera JEL478]